MEAGIFAQEAPAARSAGRVRREALRWYVLGGPVVDLGSLPSAAPGLELGGRAEIGQLAFGVASAWFPHADARIVEASADSRAKGGTFSLIGAGLRLCYRPFADIGLAGCGAAELGSLAGEGYGAERNTPRATTWVAIGPGLELRVPAGTSVALRAASDLLFPLRRPTFVLENVGPVHEVSAVSLRLSAGLSLRFP